MRPINYGAGGCCVGEEFAGVEVGGPVLMGVDMGCLEGDDVDGVEGAGFDDV